MQTKNKKCTAKLKSYSAIEKTILSNFIVWWKLQKCVFALVKMLHCRNFSVLTEIFNFGTVKQKSPKLKYYNFGQAF